MDFIPDRIRVILEKLQDSIVTQTVPLESADGCVTVPVKNFEIVTVKFVL